MLKSRLIIIVATILITAFASTFMFAADTAAVMSLKPTAAIALAMSAAVVEPLAAYTIREFCQAHGISVPTYYELKKQNLGPAEMRMGRIVRISREAAAVWRQARENPAGAEAEAATRSAEVLRDRARRAAKRAIESPKHVSRRGAEIA
jgi:predicted DNA-binding transcriptional regulator AlpA